MARRSKQKPKAARESSNRHSGVEGLANPDVDPDSAASQSTDEIPANLPVCPRWYVPSIIVVVVLALVLRLFHVQQTSTLPTVQQALGDSRGYLDWAMRLAQGDWYGTETFYQAPLYPYFLGVLIALGGPSLTWIRIVQAILGAFCAGFLGGAARRVFDAPTGVVAAVMMAFYGPGIYYDGIIQKASLSTFLLSLLIYLLAVMAGRTNGPRAEGSSAGSVLRAVAVGLALGLLCLTRENALLWIPLVPAWIWWIHRNQSVVEHTKVIGGYALGLAIILFPVAARNASLGGEWSPTTFQSGPNFYIGNGVGATGVYEPLVPGHESPEFERSDAQALAEYDSGRPLSAREVSKYWSTRALGEIAQQPGRWLGLMGRKLLMTVNYYEVPDVESPYVHRYWSTPLRLLLGVWGFGMLLPIAAVGVYLASSQFKRIWVFPAMTVTMVIAVAAFFILGRYRLPLAPLLIPYAAYAVTHFRDLSGKRTRIIGGLLFVGSMAIAYLPVHDVQGLNASSYMNTGIAFGRAGDASGSQRWIGRSIALRGETAMGLYNLAGAQLLAGQRGSAIASLETARQLDPSFIEVVLQLGRLYEEQGDWARAAERYRAAIEIDPNNGEASYRFQSIQSRLQ